MSGFMRVAGTPHGRVHGHRRPPCDECGKGAATKVLLLLNERREICGECADEYREMGVPIHRRAS